MSTTDGINPRNNSAYRWSAHPLTTLLVLLPVTLSSALTVGHGFALTMFSGSVAVISQCSDAYKPPQP
ncbi:hypothetical protein [Rhodococcus qingshengii]|uniref:hypothetical protein n=1 Tax=Rhodococcus qingshengii TaxID=334542 RepID=UPI0027A88557|nr:hypothetical protein PI247_31080 [Rhodococcus qingshengii]